MRRVVLLRTHQTKIARNSMPRRKPFESPRENPLKPLEPQELVTRRRDEFLDAEYKEGRVRSDASLLKGGAHYEKGSSGDPQLELAPEQLLPKAKEAEREIGMVREKAIQRVEHFLEVLRGDMEKLRTLEDPSTFDIADSMLLAKELAEALEELKGHLWKPVTLK